MLTRRAKAYSSSCLQTGSLSPAILSQFVLRLCVFQYCAPRPMHEFHHYWLKIANFSHITPTLALKIIQGHQIWWQLRTSVWLPISD